MSAGHRTTEIHANWTPAGFRLAKPSQGCLKLWSRKSTKMSWNKNSTFPKCCTREKVSWIKILHSFFIHGECSIFLSEITSGRKDPCSHEIDAKQRAETGQKSPRILGSLDDDIIEENRGSQETDDDGERQPAWADLLHGDNVACILTDPSNVLEDRVQQLETQVIWNENKHTRLFPAVQNIVH